MRPTNEVEATAVDDFIEGAKRSHSIPSQGRGSELKGVREAIEAKTLTAEQRQALSNTIAAVLAAAAPATAEMLKTLLQPKR